MSDQKPTPVPVPPPQPTSQNSEVPITPEPAEATIGQEPIIAETPVIEVNGQSYIMSRLGLKHMYKALRIFSRTSAGVVKHIAGNKAVSAETWAYALIGALPYAEDDASAFLASLLGVKVEEIEDPDRFPISIFPEVIMKLAVHKDFEAFLSNTQAMMKSPTFEELRNKYAPPALKSDDTEKTN